MTPAEMAVERPPFLAEIPEKCSAPQSAIMRHRLSLIIRVESGLKVAMCVLAGPLARREKRRAQCGQRAAVNVLSVQSVETVRPLKST